ncbi:MAG: hypothetical protein IPH45_03130 [Bacteroidales bacterium]|nr:hypothetical protein [Bacteroidales bacterium]
MFLNSSLLLQLMSRYYQLRILILIIPIGLLFCSRLNAATRTASASGNWNSTTTWGGSAVPTSADAVVINSGVTVTVNVAAVCASINFTTGTSGAALLTISGTNTLTVSGNVTVQRPSSTSLSNTLAVNDGSLSCVSLAIQATTSTGFQRFHFLRVQLPQPATLQH